MSYKPANTEAHQTWPVRTAYKGRFAPSPTGPLHFGSLLAALASFLDARKNQGIWLVRMEDLDPPREIPGAADQILRTLEQFGLLWDQQVIYQSDRYQTYQAIIDQLLKAGHAYYCSCSRQMIAQRGGVYDGYCRSRQSHLHGITAIRLKTDNCAITFKDQIQGPQRQQLSPYCGDFVIRRKDKLYAYQLAVVCDDAAQGISHIVRGSDLLDSTPRQLYLQQLLGYQQPCYAHIPIMVNSQGQKLSKQTFATALDPLHPEKKLYQALKVLGQQPPTALQGAPIDNILDWAIENWSLGAVPSRLTVEQQEI
ncbi:tRNA glutamyl-Q(34) synthetase GluQRS [Motiliproteus sp. MSK22-1]|nr:tRNA glutamyl-Q(34) synthetase GluQRS [Motiliproteus sp. MSK22-1]